MAALFLTNAQLQQLIALSQRAAPNEACGIIGGKGERALKIFPLENNDLEPRARYNAEPLELLRALQEIEANEWEHLAIYHSHPATPAYPSPTDIARAFYPDAIYLIISLMNPDQAMIRAFRIVEGKVKEVTIEIEETNDESPRTHSSRAARRAGGSRAGRAVAALSKRRPARGNTRPARRRVSKEV